MTQFGAPIDDPLPHVQVLQIDRDTALIAARSWAKWTPQQIQMVEEGRGDDSLLLQLLARHRRAVIQTTRS